MKEIFHNIIIDLWDLILYPSVLTIYDLGIHAFSSYFRVVGMYNNFRMYLIIVEEENILLRDMI